MPLWSWLVSASSLALLAVALADEIVNLASWSGPWITLVPEPGTAALLALGLAGLALRSRRPL